MCCFLSGFWSASFENNQRRHAFIVSPHKEEDTVKPSPTSAADEIPVACASDHRYLFGLLTTLWSLCEHASDRPLDHAPARCQEGVRELIRLEVARYRQ